MKIRILCLEDNKADAFLIETQLKREGWELYFKHVDTEKEFVANISNELWDIILSDYNLPGFNGISALIHKKQICPDVPFICISGTIGDDLAVEIYRLGAADYVLKDNLAKLPVTIEKVLREAGEQKARVAAENELKKLSKAVEQSPATIMITDYTGAIEYVNPKFTQLTGYSYDEAIGKNPSILKSGDIPPQDYSDLWNTIKAGREWHGEFRNMKKNGEIYYELASISPVKDSIGNITHYIAVKEDITTRKNYENDLRKFRLGIENSTDAIFITDLNGTIEYINPAFEKNYGFTQKEAFGNTPRILKSGSIPQEVYKQFWDTLLSGHSVKGELKNKARDGRIIDIEATNSPIIDEKGRLLGFLSINRDITERIRAGEALRLSEEKYRKIFENVQDVFYQADVNGLITDLSPSVFKMTGYKTYELIGQAIVILYENPDSRKDFLSQIEEKNEVLDYEIKIRTKSGEIRFASVNSHKLFDKSGNLIGLEGSARDITERKKVEMELIKAKDRAEESDRLKTAFLNNISHEIRTPLNAIVGFTTLLVEPDISEETRTSYLDTITQSSDNLLAIISDIIDISNVEAGIVKLSEEKIRINEVFDKLGKVFVPLAQGRGLEFRVVKNLPNDEAVILSDTQKFYQVLNNLLSNSFKFTSKGIVEAGYSIKENFIEFYVSDSGIGIPENQLTKIFDRFYQVDHTLSRTFEGTGLGLSISKAFVEYMGGRMWAESRPGNGSVFYFTLPFRKQLTEATSSPDSTRQENARIYNIVIVEDDESNARVMLSYLRQPHFKVKRFTNGQEAINYCLSEKNIDLVIMDLHLPGSGGLEVTEKLKKNFPDIKVIAQTAYALPGDKEASLAAGCDDFITKPFRKEFFISKVMEHLST